MVVSSLLRPLSRAVPSTQVIARRQRSVLTSGGLAGRYKAEDAPARTPEPAAQASATMREVALSERQTEESGSLTRVRPEGDVIAAGVASGIPEELAIRPVRIYRPSPTTMQSAKSPNHLWRVDWDILPGSSKYENPLMGWAASSDYMQGTMLKFVSKDDAIHWCEKQGLPYFVQEPKQPKYKPKSYSANYLYSPGELRLQRTKVSSGRGSTLTALQ